MFDIIWYETWPMRQAIRSALNGYDYSVIARMLIDDIKLIKYRITN